jgi:DNA-binding HxlR family transcriptional regulator
MGVERTSITGRLKELEDEGLIEKAPNKKKDPWTGHEVYWYRPR